MNNQANDTILKFRDERASLGHLAGTNDFVLTGIEQSFLLNNIQNSLRILAIGCGNGSSLMKLIDQKGCTGVGSIFQVRW